MDNSTFIAVASVISAGFATGIGVMGPGLGGKSGLSGAEFFGPATRCLRYYHPHTVCRPGDDRILCYLCLRSLHDSHFCQPILEPCYRLGRRRINLC